MSPEAWLCRYAVRGGDVLSWINPAHPGYPYPEAAGLLVRWLALTQQPAPRAVVDALVRRVAEDSVGRDDAVYAFDTAVVLAGLDALVPHAEARDGHAWTRLLEADVVRPPAPPRWSTVFGPHMLKLAVFLGARLRRGSATPMQAWLARLQQCEVFQDVSGRLHTPPHSATYLHAHAYATEGLFALQPHVETLPASLDGAIAFLRAMQSDGGGFPAWSDGGPLRADVTAQAIRLFVLHDPVAHADAIGRAATFLDTLTNADGVVRYAPDSSDLNTWCTLFACQARAWIHAPNLARAEDLL